MKTELILTVALISFFISLIAFILCALKLFKKNLPGFFVLTICSIACCLMQDIHTSIGYICGDTSEGLTISTIAIFGCFLFFLSASIGPIDKLQEQKNLKTILLSLIAPVIMIILLTISAINMYPLVDTLTFLLTIIFYLPSILVSYFVLKHILSYDELGIYKTIKGCNIIILINILLNILYLTFTVFGIPIMILIVYILRSVSMLALAIESIRGYKKWKTLL